MRREFLPRFVSDGWYLINNWAIYRNGERHYQFVLFEVALRTATACQLHRVYAVELELQLVNLGIGWDFRYTWWGRRKHGHGHEHGHGKVGRIDVNTIV